MVKLLKGLGFFTWGGGVIAGLFLLSEFNFLVALVCWVAVLIQGALMYAIGVHLENQERTLTHMYTIEEMLKSIVPSIPVSAHTFTQKTPAPTRNMPPTVQKPVSRENIDAVRRAIEKAEKNSKT